MFDLDRQPVNFKNVLIEMKDVSELMVDLAYSAILFESKEIANEVVNLEETMNLLLYQARITSILGARRLEEAESMSGLLQIAEGAERISNAASEIAMVLLKDIRIPAKMRLALPEAEEVTIRAEIEPGCDLDGVIIGDIRLQSTTGMRIIAIRRGRFWTYDPDKETSLKKGDIILAKGPEDGIGPLYRLLGVPEPSEEEEIEQALDDLDRAVLLIVEMKNISELAVGLAYTALLFDSRDIAEEVVWLNERMDSMRLQLELWVLEAAKRVEHVEYLRGLLHMSAFADAICSSAFSIVDVIMRDIEIPPIFQKIIRESDEIISRIEVKEGSFLSGKTLKEASLGAVTGMVVLAIKRGDKWIYRPKKHVRLYEGDYIIAKGRRDGECRLLALCKPEDE
ncbi:potassium channel protein [Methanocalculus taiwanensis]|uniref:Potassium channel protein n=1 Tax=Methanocalculus taiwanensis TaxID=106207 RepID=A0ABD4TIE6_9EURY|nr:TrkA C-terminal domain-containing protein [Methanocalculus taiwanensis]MCQ1537569.1 potassium channel protein [Methanocalculus taiwanensis]